MQDYALEDFNPDPFGKDDNDLAIIFLNAPSTKTTIQITSIQRHHLKMLLLG
jgi:hypothetical protein